MKRKPTKVPGKLSIAQKSEPPLRKTLHQKKMTFHLFLYAYFSLKKTLNLKTLVFKFNLVLIGVLNNFPYNLCAFLSFGHYLILYRS